MSTVILLPTNDGGYEYARIYRADSEAGTYALINTIDSIQLEYEDSGGDYSKYYKVTWYDGVTESEQIPVQSSIQKVIDIIRIECKISAGAMPNSEIEFLADQAKLAIKMDICKFKYGVQVYKMQDDRYYELPKRWYFDANFGGAVSISDFSAFKQATPIYAYTEKVDVEILDLDIDEFYIKVEPLESSEILKVNYYNTTREVKPEFLTKLMAYKIASIYFENLANASITTAASSPFAKVKIGDITVENGSSSTAGTSVNAIVDLANKMSAKYNFMVTNFKTGFIRVN